MNEETEAQLGWVVYQDHPGGGQGNSNPPHGAAAS